MVITKKFYTYPVDSILLLGPTGVGKSPLGDVIGGQGLFDRKCHHLDFGAELRTAITDGERSASYSAVELEFIHSVLERGLLLENENFPLAEKIISLFLNRVGFSQRNVLVLNGVPRHAGQARDIATIANIHALIVLDCSAETVFCRIQDNVGGDRIARVDDNKELIEKKLMIFQERTAPLIEHYTRTGRLVYRIGISSMSTSKQAYRRLLSLTTAHPPITLIAEPPQR